MWNYNQTEYLCHHGIRGQRWGVRRTDAQLGNTGAKKKQSTTKNKRQLLDEYKKQEKKEWNKQYEELKEKRNNIFEYGKKHNLDLDDGGGSGSRKAGQKYMDMWDDYAIQEDNARQAASKRAEDYINNKYGSTTMSELNKYNNRKTVMSVAAFLAVPLAGAVAVVVADSKYK